MRDHRAGENIQRAGFCVDHWSRGDTDFGLDEWALDIVRGNESDAAFSIEETDLPQRRVGGAGGIEGINAVVLGGDEEDVVEALAGNFDSWNEQRLGVNCAVDSEGAEFGEQFRVNVLRS